jgi:DMSO/TMAO reductase YedYZ molybdopterin-dependent catalytic subunit
MPRAFDSANLKPLPVHGMPNLPDPQDWQLVIHSGDRAVTFDTEAVARLPHAEEVDTFTCLAGWTAGPLRWRGVRLSILLEGLGGSRDRWIAVSAPDFCSVLPLTLLPAETLLADALDDRPLPPEHGGPFRLIVPNGICYQSVKWVQRIEVQGSGVGDTARAIALARLPVPERSGQSVSTKVASGAQ